MLTPIKAIRAHCLECCGNQRAEVRLCPSTDCALWPYRMGRRPAGEESQGEHPSGGSTGEKVELAP